jgi:hypothetical protein
MRTCIYQTTLFAIFAWPVTAEAGQLKLLPETVTLTGPQAAQRLILLTEEGGQYVGDRTNQATFTSSNPAVASVSDAGFVKAVGDGETVVTATFEDQQTTAKIKVEKTQTPLDWSFRNDVIPMMTKIGCNSGACHGALAGKGGFKLSLRGYAPEVDHFVMTRQALGRRIDRVDPSQSLVLLKPTMSINHGGGLRLEVGSSDFQILADWIASGAPGPKPDDPQIQRLEVFPSLAVLQPREKLQVLIRACYSDGSSKDVTHWTKFSSNQDLVATVDQEGRARVTGYGEAAITVWFSNRVAACRIVSPLPNRVDANVFAAAPRHNFIDDQVLKKLQALHIAPSPTCGDGEFIRRANLDAAGILPTPEEVKKFLADPAPDKRAKLIDALLERPEFIDYWAYKWSDLLLVSTRKLPQSDTWAFYQFIRQSVADNKPWDKFARDVLTSTGNTLENGAANYFVLHKDVTDLTESTSVTFMGLSINCCRCHNHPLEKWTQDQYWEMANLFSRVGMKNGDSAGSVSVQSEPTGEAYHPRRGIAMPATPLDGKPLPLDSSADRRQYFADWLTAPDNPYFAKALVNRVWRNFMGRGLVEAEDDLRETNPPTNEELFNLLAKDFVEHKFDVKYLMRLIMNSATYQRSSRPLPENSSDDRYYSHYLVRRMSAEVILDMYSQVTGVPTPFKNIYSGVEGGVAPTDNFPEGTRALQLPDSRVASSFLDSFGRPDRVQTCSCERQQDSSVSQALHLNNGQTLNDKLRAKNSRVEQWLNEKISNEEAVRRLFFLALCRAPTDQELNKFKTLMAGDAKDSKTTRRDILEDLFWALLSSKEFMFNR